MSNRVKRQGKEFRLPEGVRLDIAQSGHRTGIRWVGRTKDGVPMWTGNWRGLPKWFPWLFKGLGIGLWCLAAVFAVTGLWQAVPGPAIAGCIHLFLGFVLFERFKRQFDASMTVDEGAEQLGVGVDEFKQVVEERGIKPTHLFNDDRFTPSIPSATLARCFEPRTVPPNWIQSCCARPAVQPMRRETLCSGRWPDKSRSPQACSCRRTRTLRT